MSRRYFNLASGSTSGPHDASTTTIQFNSGQEPDFDLRAEDHAVLAWGRFSDKDTIELIHLVGPYNAGSATGTIERGQEGVSEKSHTDGEEWRLVTVGSDLNSRLFGFRPDSDLGIHEIAAGFSRGFARYYLNDVLMDTRALAADWVSNSPNQTGFDAGTPWIRLEASTFASKVRFEIDVRFDRPVTLAFEAMADDTAADSTRRVFVDGVEKVSTANVDDYGTPTSHSIDIEPGVHTVAFEYEHNSGSGTAYFGDIATTSDDAPDDGQHFQEFITEYVYEDGEYKVLSGPSFEEDLSWRASFGSNYLGSNAESAMALGFNNIVEQGEDAAVIVGSDSVAQSETILGGTNRTNWVGLQVGIGKNVVVQAESVGIGWDVQAGAEAVVTGAYSEGQARDTVYGYAISCPPIEAAGSHLTVTNFAAAASGVGTLGPADSFTYTIVPYNGFGYGASSTATVADVPADSAIDLTWDATTGANGYRVYGRSNNVGSGKQRFLADVATNSWTDDGSVEGPVETVPTNTSLERTSGPRVVIGRMSEVSAPWGIAIGADTTVTHDRSIAIGSEISTTKANQNLIGSNQNVTTLPGGLEVSVRTVTSATTLDATQKETVVLADASTGAFTVTLPDEEPGRVIVVKKIDSTANAVTVDAGGATPATIDGSSTQTLATQYNIIRLVCDGANWFII